MVPSMVPDSPHTLAGPWWHYSSPAHYSQGYQGSQAGDRPDPATLQHTHTRGSHSYSHRDPYSQDQLVLHGDSLEPARY